MSYNPNPAHQSQHIAPTAALEWFHFISQTIPPGKLPQFPKPQIIAFTRSSSAPKVKQLLGLLPELQRMYLENCSNFPHLIVLLYLLTLKGCTSTNEEFVQVSMEVLEQLLKYRIVVVCGMYKDNCTSQVYGWVDNWLSLFVPAVLMCMGVARQKARDRQIQPRQARTFISIIRQINKGDRPQSKLLLIFECLLVTKMRSHLASPSLHQLDSLLRRIYSAQKYAQIHEDGGCISHIRSRYNDGCQKHKQGEDKIVRVSELAPGRLNEASWQIYELQLKQKEQGNSRAHSKLKKVRSDCAMQQWVVDSYAKGAKPSAIKINVNTLGKMRTMEIYKFLCLLEIYGSSPNIDILNEYINDQKLLDLFTLFLLGENLSPFLPLPASSDNQELSPPLVYSYRRERLIQILEKLSSCASQISRQEQKKLLIEQFQTRLLGWEGQNESTKKQSDPSEPGRCKNL